MSLLSATNNIIRNIRAVDAVSFEADLRSSVLFTQPADKLNAYVDQLNDTMTQLLNKVAPVRSRRRRPQKPISKWLSIEAVEALSPPSGTPVAHNWHRGWSVWIPPSVSQGNQLINESRSAYYRQRIHEAGSNHKRRWKLLNDLLHSHDTDRTRTEDENRHLCTAFSNFFTDKITKLRNSVSNTLRSLPASLPSHESFPPHCGPIFDILSPVTAAEVRKLLSSSLPKSSVMDIIPTSLILRCQSVFFWNHRAFG